MGSQDRSYLISGAAGFIGANLCHRLIAQGAEVHAMIRPGSNQWRLQSIQDRMRIHEVDIGDESMVRELVETVRPTVIYHLATHGAYHYQNDPKKILLTNVFGLWNLLTACDAVGYELFVNTGSSSEYGSKQFAMREDDVLEPNSYYAVAKAGQTLLCKHVARTEDRAIVTIRPFSVYGPWEEPSRLMPKLMTAAIRGEPIDLVAPETCRDFIYVDDVVDAFLMIDELKLLRGEELNVGTGVQTTLRDLVAITGEQAGSAVQARWGSLAARSWDTNVWVADICKMRRLTGWNPKVTVPQGVARCLDWYRAEAAQLGARG